MTLGPRVRSLFRPFDAWEPVLSRKGNMVTFLLIRFLIMSAMVVGFSWIVLGVVP